MQVFNPSQISLAQLLNEARANRGKISHIYLHWTAGRYNQFFDDYHLNIDGEGKVFRTCSSLDQLKAHTYQRNSGSIGITLCCALGASWQGQKPDLGSCPPKTMQLIALAKVIAVLCAGLGLEVDSTAVMTHAEAALVDGYGAGSGDSDTRWDLYWVPGNGDQLVRGGDRIRELAQHYSKVLLLLAPRNIEQV